MDVSFRHSVLYADITLLSETFIVKHSPLQLYAAFYVRMNTVLSVIFAGLNFREFRE